MGKTDVCIAARICYALNKNAVWPIILFSVIESFFTFWKE